MPSKIREKILQRISKISFHNSDEAYLFLLLHVAVIFVILVHVYMLIIYSIYQLIAFVIPNLVCLIVDIFCFLLLRRRFYLPVGILISIEVCLYATFFICFTGTSTYFFGYYLLVLVMQIVTPYASYKFRVCIGIFIFAGTTFLLFSRFFLHPSALISQGLLDLLFVSNIYLMLIGTTFQLYISNFLRILIRDMQNSKIDKLSVQAYTDALTGLYNRHYFDVHLKSNAQSYSGTFCHVAMLDIDNFKMINDIHGHAAGDIVLRNVSELLRSNIRKNDALFRWGGEEFLILLHDVEPDAAFSILNKIRDIIKNTPIPLESTQINITATIGVCEFTIDEPLQCIKKCDNNLYIGKRGAKNIVVIS